MLSVTRNVIPNCSQVIFKCRSSGAAGSSVTAAVLGSVRVALPCQEAVDPVDTLMKSDTLWSHWTC